MTGCFFKCSENPNSILKIIDINKFNCKFSFINCKLIIMNDDSVSFCTINTVIGCFVKYLNFLKSLILSNVTNASETFYK